MEQGKIVENWHLCTFMVTPSLTGEATTEPGRRAEGPAGPGPRPRGWRHLCRMKCFESVLDEVSPPLQTSVLSSANKVEEEGFGGLMFQDPTCSLHKSGTSASWDFTCEDRRGH